MAKAWSDERNRADAIMGDLNDRDVTIEDIFDSLERSRVWLEELRNICLGLLIAAGCLVGLAWAILDKLKGAH